MIGFKIKQIIKMIFQNGILPICYWFHSRGKINEKLVVFADAHHDSIPYSMEDIYEQVKKLDVQIVVCCTNYKTNSALYIFRSMIRFMRIYGKAKYVFICDNYLPVASCNKRKETEVIQLWHAGGVLKKFAYDTERDIPKYYKGHVYKNYTLVTVSAECCREVYISAMRTPPENVKATGLSRTDRYFRDDYIRQCKEEFYEAYPEAMGKKIILWAPTFRGNAANPQMVGLEDMQSLQQELGEDWYVLIKVHPHIDNIEKLSNCEIQTERLLPVIDVLISDYSSVIYDYILLDKPLVLYVPDLQYYVDNRQLYIDFDEMPGMIVKEYSELAKNVTVEYSNYNKEKMKIFRENYMQACDGHATERILKTIGLM